MITEQDLQEAIAECQGERNPNANTCIKLAAFYTIRNELFPEPKKPVDQTPAYSFAAAPAPKKAVVDYDGESEFAQLINGRDPDDLWPIIDELVGAVQTLLPRLYNSFMDSL